MTNQQPAPVIADSIDIIAGPYGPELSEATYKPFATVDAAIEYAVQETAKESNLDVIYSVWNFMGDDLPLVAFIWNGLSFPAAPLSV